MSEQVNWAEFYRTATPEQKAERKAIRAAEQAAVAAKAAHDAAEYRVERVKAMTDEGLQASIDAGQVVSPAGFHPRQAAALKRVPFEHRERVYNEGGTRQNMRGGILSDNVWEAASDMLGMIANGNADAEMYGEKAARQDRERQVAESEARLAQAVQAAAK